MKKVIIIHCWEGYPNYCWYPHTKKELENKGYEVIVPEMPETNFPKFDKWLSKLREVVEEPDENVYLIGHSLGCITILRYLESLEENERIGGAILVAGFTDNLGYEEIKTFFDAPIDFEKIKTRCPNFVAIHSDNDPYVPLKHGDIFKEELVALPGICEILAQRIIDYRNTYGPFKSIRVVMKIRGIAKGTFNKVKEKVAVQ